jgi:hypothetical protein
MFNSTKLSAVKLVILLEVEPESGERKDKGNRPSYARGKVRNVTKDDQRKCSKMD